MNVSLESIVHLDRSLGQVIEAYGFVTYVLVFVVIFAEVGLVITGFLPGDSLVFAVGAFSAAGLLDPWLLFAFLSAAATAGNMTNFGIGCWIGPVVIMKGRIPFIKKHHLEKTHMFYQRHGGKAVVIARFLPVVRSVAPLVAGIAGMGFRRFAVYSFAAGTGWTALYLWGGYFFGAIPFVKKYFILVIAAVILVTILPGILGYFARVRMKRAVP